MLALPGSLAKLDVKGTKLWEQEPMATAHPDRYGTCGFVEYNG